MRTKDGRFALGSKARLKHGMARTRIYYIWASMVERCADPRNRAYKNYGGRGITVSGNWMKFERFYSDMGERPADMSLDRIDNNAGYSVENCRWASRLVQGRNRRGLRMVTANGRTRPLHEWADETGISIGTLWMRLAKGWEPDAAFTTPLLRKRKGIPRGTRLRDLAQ